MFIARQAGKMQSGLSIVVYLMRLHVGVGARLIARGRRHLTFRSVTASDCLAIAVKIEEAKAAIESAFRTLQSGHIDF